MPKKHQQSFLKTNSNYVHPSLGSSSKSTQSTPPATLTVNEKLSQLRLAQATPEATERQRALAESLNQRSVPPSLGGILGVPESAPPAPKPGHRPRIRLRTPGPAPPRSWLVGQATEYRLAPRGARNFGSKPERTRKLPAGLCRFLDVIGERTVERGSLMHLSLRSIAQNWDAVVEEGLEYLADLPEHLRVTLISYLASYGPPAGISISSLGALIYGNAGLTCLDLSSLVGWGFSPKELNSCLTRSVPAQAGGHSGGISSTGVADSWDAEETAEEVHASIPQTLVLPAHGSLTKLSLSRPSTAVNWKDLLHLTAKLPTLTHLSLAYWPGTYEGMSMNLRQLSRQTYCLRWLDLEGCDFAPSLYGSSRPGETSTGSPQYHMLNPSQQAALRDLVEPRIIVPDWAGSWKQLTYLNLSRGWHPNNIHQVERLARTKLEKDFADWLLSHSEDVILSQCIACGSTLGSTNSTDGCAGCTAYQEQYAREFYDWSEKQSWAVETAVACRSLRGHSNHGPLTVDVGWRMI